MLTKTTYRYVIALSVTLLCCASVMSTRPKHSCQSGFSQSEYNDSLLSLAGRTSAVVALRVVMHGDSFILRERFDKLYGCLYRQIRSSHPGNNHDDLRHLVQKIPTTITYAILNDAALTLPDDCDANSNDIDKALIVQADSLIRYSDDEVLSFIDTSRCTLKLQILTPQQRISVMYALTQRRYIMIASYDDVYIVGKSGDAP